MAVWIVEIKSPQGQGDPAWGQCSWTEQWVGLAGVRERSPVRIASRNQQVVRQNQNGRCSTFARKPAGLRRCVAGDSSSTEGRRQENLWRQLFQDPTVWWDHRQSKKSCRSPDFRHRQSHEVLWLNSFHKPAWVDAQLAALDMAHRSLPHDPDPRRSAGQDRGVSAETVIKLCHEGHLSEAVEALEVLVLTDSCISKNLFYTVLRKCVVEKDLVQGSRVHAFTVTKGYQSDTFLCNHILRMYASHGRLQDAMDVFEGVAEPDTFMWYSIISAHVKQGRDKLAIQLYYRMRRSSVKPDTHVFVAALQACARGSDLRSGQQVHADVLVSGVEPGLFVCNCLVNMYAKCGSLEEARGVFDGLCKRDVVTWNAMIAGYSQQGMGEEALRLYAAMREEGMAVPNPVTFVSLLQACARMGALALEKGQQIHAQIRAQGHEADVFVANSLINMYAKCGSLEDAQRVFDRLGQKNVVTWNALIAGYSQQGMGLEALQLWNAMEESGMAVANSVTYTCLLQACASVGTPALEKGRQLHLHLRDRGHEADVFVANSLVTMYAKCGSLEDARRLFDGLGEKNVVTWNAMIAGYLQGGMGHEALRLYSHMQQFGMPVPDSVTFKCLLQACASTGTPALERGKQLHAQIRERGLEADVFVGNSLVNMYAKCGCLEIAQSVFDGLGQKNAATWNAMIAGYSQQRKGEEALHIYSAMQEEGMAVPDSVTFVCLLQACASVGTSALEKGKHLHEQMREGGHEADVFVASSLVNMYVKCGSLNDAQRVFDRLAQKNVVTWNTIIAGYSQQGMGQEAICLYSAMQEEGVAVPNSVTFLSVLQACACVGNLALETGKQIHLQIREGGHDADVFVTSSLMNMYANCGSLEDAQQVFDGLDRKDVVTWNAMIAGYSHQGMGHEALRLYCVMQEEGGAVPDSVTFLCLLQACASIGIPAFEKGKQLHTKIREQGFEGDMFVASGLVNMYAKCGSLKDAQKVFDRLGQKDVVTWNAMIAGYSQQGMGQEALRLYSSMLQEGRSVPDPATFVCLLQACANVAALGLGRQVHAHIIEQGLQANVLVAGSLINMYGKSGSTVHAQEVFDALAKRDVVAWNSLIASYTCDGNSEVVFDLVQKMRVDGIRPDSITLLSVLTVCSHRGLVTTGRNYFDAMSRDYGIIPTENHYTCMVDLLGRGGQLDEALGLVMTMPVQPNAAVWRTLLSACRKWGNVEVGYHAFNEAVKLDQNDAAPYVLMANIYISAQMWEQAQKMQARRKRIGAWKQPGQSWWTDINGLVHSFLVGDDQSETGTLISEIKEDTDLPHLNSSLTETSCDRAEHRLCGYSEKQALAYPGNNITEPTPMIAVKNVRVCVDCHSVAFISPAIIPPVICRNITWVHVYNGGSRALWFFPSERSDLVFKVFSCSGMRRSLPSLCSQ